MNCSEFNKLLDNYESLSAEELSLLDVHAAECDVCRSELNFFKSIVLTSSSLPVPEPPADLLDKVNSRIDSMPASISRIDRVINSFRCNTSRYVTAAACLAVGIIVGLNSKTIGDMLNNSDNGGVISTNVSVSDSQDEDNTELPAEDPAPVSETEEAKTVIPTEPIRNVVKQQPKKTVSPASETRKPAGVFSGTVTAGSEYRPVIKPEIVSEQPKAPEIQETPKVTEPTAAAVNGRSGSRYVIARDNYHIPDTQPTEAVKVTAEPSTAAAETITERYQIATGSYELPDDEKQKLLKNKLIINEDDVEAVTECMRDAGIRGTTNGYVGSTESIANLLAMLSARNIYYNYAECVTGVDEVVFILLVN